MNFGSPGAGDATSRLEQKVARVAAKYLERVQRGADILNRPMGSNASLSKEEKIADWQMKVADPNLLVEEMQQRVQVVGPERLKYEYRKWTNEMQKLAGMPHYDGE